MSLLDRYKEVWFIDFEFHAPPGERPEPLCMVAQELWSGRRLALWADELKALSRAPFDTGRSSLVVSFYASAEMGCFLALGWEPARFFDNEAKGHGITLQSAS
jgi:hypothetical protein